MIEQITIRPVRPSDSEAVRAIYNHAVIHSTATFDVEERTTEQQQLWMEAHDGILYPAIVAQMEACGTVVGYASLSKFSAKPGYKRTVENSLYTHPDWRGRGVGGLLLAELIAQAHQREFTTIVALVTADNEASLRLHRRLGFVDSGLLRRVGWKHGREIDVAYLQLFLRGSEDEPLVFRARG